MATPAKPKDGSKALALRKNVPSALRPRIGLALGGGGARGLAHILMLEVFEEMGLKPSIIAGTSIGAIFGAAFAAGVTAREMRLMTEKALSSRVNLARLLLSARAEPILKLMRFLPLSQSLLNAESVLRSVLPEDIPADFSQLSIPLRVLATDFYGQDQLVIERGPLVTAIAASIALPVVFTPVTRDGRVLMDGGLVNPLPFDVLQGEADITVAIDVSGSAVQPGWHPAPSAYNALITASQILQRAIVREKLKAQQPDIYIDVEVDDYGLLDFHKFQHILQASIPAQEKLRRQLRRVLSSQPAETLPATQANSAPKQRTRMRGLARPSREETE